MHSNQFTVLIERLAKGVLVLSVVASMAACGGGTDDTQPSDEQQDTVVVTDNVGGLVISERPRAVRPATTVPPSF
jgi:hypothetical protein